MINVSPGTAQSMMNENQEYPVETEEEEDEEEDEENAYNDQETITDPGYHHYRRIPKSYLQTYE